MLGRKRTPINWEKYEWYRPRRQKIKTEKVIVVSGKASPTKKKVIKFKRRIIPKSSRRLSKMKEQRQSGMTFQSIANFHGISRQRVHYLLTR